MVRSSVFIKPDLQNTLSINYQLIFRQFKISQIKNTPPTQFCSLLLEKKEIERGFNIKNKPAQNKAHKYKLASMSLYDLTSTVSKTTLVLKFLIGLDSWKNTNHYTHSKLSSHPNC